MHNETTTTGPRMPRSVALLSSGIVAFQAAALPFRARPEVRRTLQALDKLPLEDVFALHCYDDVAATPEQIAALLPKIDEVRAKLEAVAAACPSP